MTANINLENLISLIFYLTVFASAGWLAHLSVRNKKRQSFYITMAILLPTLLGGLRYMVGIDYKAYVEKLHYLSDIGISQYLGTGLKNIFEPTMYILSHTTFNSPTQAIGFFAITSALIAGFYYFAARRFSPNHTGLLFFLLLMTVFPRDLNGVRQGVAAAICFYAISLMVDKQIFKHFKLIILAGLFHYSAFVMLVAYPIYRLLFSKIILMKDKIYIYKITLFTSLSYFSSLLVIKNIAKIPFFGRYSYLLSPEKLATAGSPNILTKIAPILLILPFYPKLVKQDKRNAYYVLMSIIAVVLTSIGIFAGSIYRLANYFMPFYAILFVNTIDVLRTRQNRRYASLFIIIYAVIFFIGSQLIRNSHGIFPYQFIF